MNAELDPKAKRKRPDLEKGAAHEKVRGHEAAQRCKNDSWWRLLRKRWRPKRLETCAALQAKPGERPNRLLKCSPASEPVQRL